MDEDKIDGYCEVNKYNCYNRHTFNQNTPVKGLHFDYNGGFRIKLPKGKYRVEVYSHEDEKSDEFTSQEADIVTKNAIYYTEMDFKVFQEKDLVFEHKFDLKGKKVLIVLPTWKVIGDTLAWIPCVEEFRKLHQCQTYVLMTPELGAILAKGYPNLHFVYASEEEWLGEVVRSVPPDIYATYHIGVFFRPDDNFLQKVPYQQLSLQRVGATILGLDNFPETKPRISPTAWSRENRVVKEPYVCISYYGLPRQQWNNAKGWIEVVKYLKQLGYRVFCIDIADERQDGPRIQNIPFGCEDLTGDIPLQERIDILWHCDFFIGISSGLSWLAWALGKPVILISGFTLPINEFYTPYRVISYNGCNGCWNDNRIYFNMAVNDCCPRHQGTERQFECSRFITPEKVCKVIDRCIADIKNNVWREGK